MKTSFILFLFFLLSFYSTQAQDKEKKRIFKDTLDNKMDASKWLIDYHGVLPVPSLITEPAIGYGGGLALVYLERPKKKSVSEKKGVYSMPNAYFGFGMYTESNTYAGMGGFYRSINGDRMRLTGLGGYTNINTQFYQINEIQLEKPIEMNVAMILALARLETRIKESNFFVGAKYLYQNTEFGLNLNSDNPIFEEIENLFHTQINNGSLSFSAFYETRDNRFTPNKGLYVSAEAGFHDSWTISDYSYQTLETSVIYYADILKNPIIGLRFDANNTFGDFPTFFKPYVSLRGVPAIRYQGLDVITLENEERINLNFRWSIVAFTGVGFTNNNQENFDLKYQVWTIGTGFRYQLARVFKMYMGIDIARSSDNDFAWYITFGNAWMR